MNEEKIDELLRLMRAVVPDTSDMSDAGKVGFVYRGVYDNETDYEEMDVTLFGQSLWTPKMDTTGNPPPDQSQEGQEDVTENDFWILFLPGALGSDYVKKTDIAAAPTEDTQGKAGIVIPDGKTITISEDGTITGSAVRTFDSVEDFKAAYDAGEVVDGMTVNIKDYNSGVIDSALSETSENPVQNKVITEKFAEAEEVRQLKTYTDLASLGLTTSDTMETIYTSIPFNSVLFIQVNSTNNFDSSWNFPDTHNGTLVLYRFSNIRGWLEYHIKDEPWDWRMDISNDSVCVPTGEWKRIAIVDNIVNPSILANGDFRINRNGKESYSEVGYTVDMWKLSYTGCTVTPISEGLQMDCAANAAHFGMLIQNIDNGLEQYKGKKLTLSAEDSSGMVKSITVTVPLSAALATLGTVEINSATISMQVNASGDLYAQIKVNAGNSAILKWIKLELGSVATPFMADSALEWERCLRHDFSTGKLTEGALYSNENIVINPKLNINQRGKTEYAFSNTERKYTVDRWRTNLHQYGTVTINDGYVTISQGNVASAGAASLTQFIENAKDYAGMTLTLTAKARGTNGSIALNIQDNNSTTIKYFQSTAEWKIYTIQKTLGDITELGVSISLEGTAGNSADFAWAKLEVGNIATPFVPPDPVTELLKCQKYYLLLNRFRVPVAYIIGNQATWFVPYYTKMRVTPTVKNLGCYIDGANNIDILNTPTWASLGDNGGNIRIDAQLEGDMSIYALNNLPLTSNTDDQGLELDAEIY